MEPEIFSFLLKCHLYSKCLYLSVGDGAPLLVDLVTDLLCVGDKLCGVGVVTLLYGLVNTGQYRVFSENKIFSHVYQINFIQHT